MPRPPQKGKKALALLLGATLCASASQIKFNLGQVEEGRLPEGLVSLVTGEGPPGAWRVTEEKVASSLPPMGTNGFAPSTYTAKHNVLAQAAATPLANHFPLLLYTNEVLGDFTITTRLKILGGTMTPEAGVAFRAQDQSNYYVVRASAEGNVLWYRVVNGVRYQDKGIGVKFPIQTNVWYELAVQCAGNQFRCLLNGQLIIPPAKAGAPTEGLAINDSTFATGKAGLWTAADTTAYFADTRIDYTPRVPFVQTAVAEIIQRYPRLLGLKIYSMKDSAAPVVIADGKASDLGAPGGKTETEVIQNGTPMYLKLKDSVELTLPLRDRNGDIVAAMKVTMTSFKGETTDTSATRALVVKQALEARLNTLQDINQ